MFRLVACAFLGSASIVALAFAAAPNIGRDIAATCATCHTSEAAGAGAIPSLTGLDSATLVARMNEFRGGRRPSTVMQQLARGYTDAEIEAVAAYLAAQKAK
jgi:cytochrome c553